MANLNFNRPEILFPCFAQLMSLQGIGPRTADIMAKRIGSFAIDLAFYFPVSLIDRSASPDINAITDGQIVTVSITIRSLDIPMGRQSRPARIVGENDTGRIELIYFRAKADYLKSLYAVGKTVIISGRVDFFNQKKQITHPDYVVAPEQRSSIPAIEPIYPLSAGLRQSLLRKTSQTIIQKMPELPEWIDKHLKQHQNWPDFKSALIQSHSPNTQADLELDTPHRRRLAFDELLANQLALCLIRSRQSNADVSEPVTGDEHFIEKFVASLPYSMTSAQMRVLNEITNDQSAPVRMLRLLQGDVGSGKTLVALIALLRAITSGKQAALLAPTEILSKQHFKNITELLKDFDIEPVLLIGSMTQKQKQVVHEGLKSGTISFVIGTHALLTENAEFADLGLAVVDEQHRFGVKQRLILGQKGGGCDILIMTATPIPRTLAMTAYGDLKISQLDEKPAGRRDIKTASLHMEKMDDVIERLSKAIANGSRAYWICPLVEESDKLDAEAAEDRHRMLAQLLPEANPVLAHGKMKSTERIIAMQAFQSGESQLLVATTVVEVGVDIPEAGIIIIENAERFGLAQLHQLRGRVGRSDIQSSCLLLYQTPLSYTAKSRLDIMRQTNDGFLIAEEDLRLRGPGEVLGQRQSGVPEFKLANLSAHADLLEIARKQSLMLVHEDPLLTSEKGKACRILIGLFEQDTAIRYLYSG